MDEGDYASEKDTLPKYSQTKRAHLNTENKIWNKVGTWQIEINRLQ